MLPWLRWRLCYIAYVKPALVTATLLLLAGAAALTAIPSGEPRASTPNSSIKASQDAAKQSSAASSGADDSHASKRKIPCKTPENAAMCYRTRGRLSVYEGDPTLRIWKIGTQRILGVYNGPSHFPPRISSFDDDVFNPELPTNLRAAYLDDRRHWEKNGNTGYGPPDIFADFEVCPLEPEKKGETQAVCIEAAKNVIVKNRWR